MTTAVVAVDEPAALLATTLTTYARPLTSLSTATAFVVAGTSMTRLPGDTVTR